jgi:hypothetical protein
MPAAASQSAPAVAASSTPDSQCCDPGLELKYAYECPNLQIPSDPSNCPGDLICCKRPGTPADGQCCNYGYNLEYGYTCPYGGPPSGESCPTDLMCCAPDGPPPTPSPVH